MGIFTIKERSAKSAVFWGFLERVSSQATGFLIGIILARLLSPSDYGTMGLLTIFIAVAATFVDAGFGSALIRKLDRDEDDLTTAFYFNILAGGVLFGLLCLMSPCIAAFYGEPVLVPLVCLAGLNLLFNSFCVVQRTLMAAKLDIKASAFITLSTQLPSGVVAILMAYNGFGLYSLVAQSLVATAMGALMIWFISDWRPRGRFTRKSLGYLWGFGSKLLAANLIGAIFNEIYSCIIGKCFRKEQLGYYTKAASLNNCVKDASAGLVMRVTLPVMSRYQSSTEVFREKFREIMLLMLLVVAPISAYMTFSAKEIIVLLWTDKWASSAPILQILLFGSLFLPISQLSLSSFQALGRTDITLKLELPKKVIYCCLIACGIRHGVIGVVIAQALAFIVGSVINLIPTKRLFNYGYIKQVLDIAKYISFAYLIAFPVSRLVAFDAVVYSVIVRLGLIIPLYLLVLLVVRDNITIKYLGIIGQYCGMNIGSREGS
ncbi:MAG: lipopolysaccharide biosynthesis protein [Kiritimatiellae bacterium]|nr:lipopolysaccharide biosynthesis protein [Kiritimatiellia bacterium]